MPFIESSESLRAQIHATDTPTPVLVGVLVVVGIACVLFAGNVLDAASGTTFALESSASSSLGLVQESGFDEVGDKRAFRIDELTNGDSLDSSDESQRKATAGSQSELVVFVSGHVADPGVRKLAEGARVGDAIEAAGGFLDDADSAYNNLARPLIDGEQIHVPSVEEAAPSAPSASSPLPSGSATQQESQLININTATAEELESLPGVGPSTAAKIVASREQDGPFSSPDDLMRVSGIGDKKYAALADLICT